MRFYDRDIVAARPNPAMPFGAGPYRRFVAAIGYLQAQFLLTQLADIRSDSEAVFARGAPEH